MASALPCKDFSEFKEALQQMRTIDDSIVYKLNTSVPTLSFSDQISGSEQCKSLYEQLQSIHQIRTTAIERCVEQTTRSIEELSDERSRRPEDGDVRKRLRKAQTNLRLMQSEVVVEEVIRDRTIKVSAIFGVALSLYLLFRFLS